MYDVASFFGVKHAFITLLRQASSWDKILIRPVAGYAFKADLLGCLDNQTAVDFLSTEGVALPGNPFKSMKPSVTCYAYLVSSQVTARPSYGGILFPSAIGAVVDGTPTTFHTPLSGHVSPVRA